MTAIIEGAMLPPKGRKIGTRNRDADRKDAAIRRGVSLIEQGSGEFEAATTVAPEYYAEAYNGTEEQLKSKVHNVRKRIAAFIKERRSSQQSKLLSL